MEKKMTTFNSISIWRLLVSPMLFLQFIILFSVSSVMAETWYIKPSAEIPVRRGQGTQYKIVAILPDGAEVTIVEDDDPWVRIETRNGKEGWMMKKYLSREQPLTRIVDRLRKENGSLKEKQTAISTQNDEMGSRSDNLQKELDSCIVGLTETQEQYQTLKHDTADVILIKDNLTQSEQTITTLQQELSVVSEENERLKGNQNIKWFLAGGGTLIFGCIVGVLSSKSRKRRSSLY